MLGPYWTPFAAHFATDRNIGLRQFLKGGVEKVLAEANPSCMRWESPVLEIREREADVDIRLQGQGVLLVPSMFATRSMIEDGAKSQLIVTYPASHNQLLHPVAALAAQCSAPTSSRAVAALLGHTRAAVLSAIAEHSGCTTVG